jgi:hypothetical protein
MNPAPKKLETSWECRTCRTVYGPSELHYNFECKPCAKKYVWFCDRCGAWNDWPANCCCGRQRPDRYYESAVPSWHREAARTFNFAGLLYGIGFIGLICLVIILGFAEKGPLGLVIGIGLALGFLRIIWSERRG